MNGLCEVKSLLSLFPFKTFITQALFGLGSRLGGRAKWCAGGVVQGGYVAATSSGR